MDEFGYKNCLYTNNWLQWILDCHMFGGPYSHRDSLSKEVELLRACEELILSVSLLRRAARIHRRRYSVAGPNALW